MATRGRSKPKAGKPPPMKGTARRATRGPVPKRPVAAAKPKPKQKPKPKPEQEPRQKAKPVPKPSPKAAPLPRTSSGAGDLPRKPRPQPPPLGPQRLSLPPSLAREVRGTIAEWVAGEKMARLWRGDATLWTGRDEDRWVGWLRLVEQQRARREEFGRVSEDVRLAAFGHAVVLGMGGSSLCPDVFASTFGRVPGHPVLRVLDSTVPAQIRALEREIDLRRTLFIVASKSGTTIEPAALLAHFLDRTGSVLGSQAASRFVAITDPGTDLEKQAQREGFRKIFHGLPSVGGRFSALSHFGMVPAAAMGVNVPRLLDRALVMADACGADRPGDENPGLVLGVVMGAAARDGVDKLTLVASPGIAGLAGWIEQLVAESLGKQGKGVVPVVGEPAGPPRSIGEDRLFVYVRLAFAPSEDQDRAVAALERAGVPVVRIDLSDPADIGQEFFRWEIATAVAGSILGVNPFDQPDVEAAKVAARKVTASVEETGTLPPEAPALVGDGLRLFADAENARFLAGATRDPSPAGWIRAHLARLRKGDYLALNAFLEQNAPVTAALQEVRESVRGSARVATTLGFGPRFLHSTGQLHKGGPDSGVFLQITADDAEPLPIPGRRFGFGELCRAQARGDHEVLAARGRRILRVHLGADVKAGLAALRRAVGRQEPSGR